MEEKIDLIIRNHCKQFKKINKTQSISKIIKSLDCIVQDLYLEIYTLRDERKAVDFLKQRAEDKKAAKLQKCNHC